MKFAIMMSAGYALLLAAVFCSQATTVEVNEVVLEEGASGTSAVLLSVAHIRQAVIFPDDNQLLRRIARVETRDGTNFDCKEGGIWTVNKTMFESTKDTTSVSLALKRHQILQQFGILWQNVHFSDLRKPIYSAIAARLVLFMAPQSIPSDTDVIGQAQFWKDNYNTGGSANEFIRATRELHNRGAPGSDDLSENIVSDFYIGFARNIDQRQPVLLQLFITTREPGSVNFTIKTLLGFNFTGVVTQKSTTVVSFDSSYEVLNSDERNKGIYVSAGDKQISVYGLNYYEVSSDAVLISPCSRLPLDQYEYYAISYNAMITYDSQFLIVGCEDNTTITFASTTITLNQMETYIYQNSSDVTGTKVISNKPISFFSGHQCTYIPEDVGYCDHLVEQIPPTATWGTSFLAASFSSRNSGEIFRILVSQPSTIVSVNCTTYTQPVTYSLATAGAWQEFMTPDNSFCVIESNKPLLVVEFALGHELDGTGDPFMVRIPPVTQYRNDYVFNAPAIFSRNFITIFVTPKYFDPTNILVDNINQELTDWTAIFCLNKTVCGYATYANLEAGDHHVYHIDPMARIGVSVYGFNNRSSYGYFGDLQPIPVQSGADDFNNNHVTIARVSIAAAVAILLMVSGCVVAGVLYWRFCLKHKRSRGIAVTYNTAYTNFIQLHVACNNACEVPIQVASNDAYEEPIQVASNDAYEEPIQVASNNACDVPIQVVHNDAYEDTTQVAHINEDPTQAASNDAYEDPIEVACNENPIQVACNCAYADTIQVHVAHSDAYGDVREDSTVTTYTGVHEDVRQE